MSAQVNPISTYGYMVKMMMVHWYGNNFGIDWFKYLILTLIQYNINYLENDNVENIGDYVKIV